MPRAAHFLNEQLCPLLAVENIITLLRTSAQPPPFTVPAAWQPGTACVRQLARRSLGEKRLDRQGGCREGAGRAGPLPNPWPHSQCTASWLHCSFFPLWHPEAHAHLRALPTMSSLWILAKLALSGQLGLSLNIISLEKSSLASPLCWPLFEIHCPSTNSPRPMLHRLGSHGDKSQPHGDSSPSPGTGSHWPSLGQGSRGPRERSGESPGEHREAVPRRRHSGRRAVRMTRGPPRPRSGARGSGCCSVPVPCELSDSVEPVIPPSLFPHPGKPRRLGIRSR